MNREHTECLTYSVIETAKILGISKTHAYEAAQRGEIPSIKIGTRRVVPKAALQALLNQSSNGLAVGTPVLIGQE